MGELARASGMTVRTLHHYDEIGLVEPSERTSSGHRRYTSADVRRLYRVRALRSMGVPLEEIRRALSERTDDVMSLREVLTHQLDQLDAEARRVRRLRGQVRGLLDRLSTAVPEPEEFLEALEMMAKVESYFTPDQLDRMARRREELGEATITAVEAEWPRLIAEVDGLRARGTPVDDPRVRALARRWAELVRMFHGGDPEIIRATGRLWAEQGQELLARFNAPSPDLFAYVAEAQKAAGIDNCGIDHGGVDNRGVES
nr:MerR family transcriptional regulator [Streptoalloteichus tenebrarius]